VGAAQEAVERVDDLGGEHIGEVEADELLLAAGVEHLGEGAVGQHDLQGGGRERDDAVGDGFDDGLELGAALLQRGVDLRELVGGAGGDGVGRFEIGGHRVEAGDKLAEFVRGGFGDAMRVVAVGDGLHGVGEGLHRAGDLLAEVEREPAAGEERQRGDEQQVERVEPADLAALAEERPVGVRGFAQAQRWRRCREGWEGPRRPGHRA
jgi:hypothetical protein